MDKRRVVVTGMGIISPLGNSVTETWRNILAGKSGIAAIDRFDVSEFATRIGGAIKNFDINDYMSAKEAKRFDPFIHYGVAAAEQALEDSGIEVNDTNAHRIGTAIGSGIGGIGLIENSRQILNNGGPRKISPFTVPGAIINMIAGVVAIKHNLQGPSIAIATACTTGTHNIGMAARMIAYGDADAMLAGGAEMATTPVGLGAFAAARAMSTRNDDPERASRPWDKNRDGFVLGDGAGMLMLEEYEFAKRRGAHIHAEILGFGMSCDAFHMTSPPEDGRGARAAMQSALDDARLNADQVDYINAHGTSTPAGDVAESRAIESLLGPAAEKIAVSSTKSMVGHLLGASGAVEAIFSILALRDQVAPPTINLDDVEEGCNLNYVPHTAQPRKLQRVLSNSFGFGGTNGSLLFGQLSS
ncbi:3-oxoacyl-ACP synthase [gamma proteobacterium BDW918]|jgi:3-oxoacyl-[acyl-carrier-protein] synthase II|uniref:3-oxoacyl-[acyl-carrier-protein] synthase 2 n=1 Tax=Zhongshania aliphaticivorans TaxID=1470434 RepID=A0A127M5J8_9GAMM|nr:beta-ketoacyl-ACP synthase II [Zhongshania aliphaticivorans]AMO68524.1 beta-ketoacyl-[acyl-carrier-protein] synthase II [Zhongshania aliphaticivorans]EIF43246.1 3-oxoacyl-ACP synthase [gamma proteobacterium BDW918]|tara:strand:+ start:26179 stop:27423 length:1245 start_codon:yes stop_codon:yes gene_type:complete